MKSVGRTIRRFISSLCISGNCKEIEIRYCGPLYPMEFFLEVKSCVMNKFGYDKLNDHMCDIIREELNERNIK